MCPDFAAEHADISTGGIGAFGDWTLTIVRTDLGRDLIVRMLEDGTIEGRPGDDDPGAIELLRRLSHNQRKRWPEVAVDAPRLRPPDPPKKKKAAAPPPEAEPEAAATEPTAAEPAAATESAPS
jgi:coenzyme F420 hydrogenase subunit beta